MGNTIKNKEDVDVHFRMTKENLAMLDACAEAEGISRAQFVRDNILKLIHGTISQYAFAELDGRIRQTVKELLDTNFQSEIDLKKKILSELERANLMSLKNYILQNPGLDPTEYKAYYYQSKGESQKISKGQLQVESLIERTRMENDLKDLDDWKKAITEGEDE